MLPKKHLEQCIQIKLEEYMPYKAKLELMPEDEWTLFDASPPKM